MAESHFIDEQDGRIEARACTGCSLSMLFFRARSILVSAPKGNFTLR